MNDAAPSRTSSSWLGMPLVALVTLLFGFLLANQLRAQLVPADQVSRNAALVSSAQDLMRSNAQHREQVQRLRSQVAAEEEQASDRSAATRQLSDRALDLRDHAGLTMLRGPGVTVRLGPGHPRPGDVDTRYRITYQDLQDVVNVLFAGGAEGVAVNGHRLSPISYFRGMGDTVEIDGSTLKAPYQVMAIGNQGQMLSLLTESRALGDLKSRQRSFQLELGWNGTSDLQLAAFDSSLETEYAHAA